MLPTREGRYRAQPLEYGVDETGPNKLTTFTCRFDLVQELVNGMWTHVEEGLEITGYFYLEKKDKALNTVTIKGLKAAFGWDGRETFWLQDTDLRQITVQLKLGLDTYDGTTRMKVQFIDAEDASPNSVSQASDVTRRAINARLGPKLRAHAGGTPVSTPRPNPESRPAATAAPAVVSECDRAKQQAWVAFTAACPSNLGDRQKEIEWFRVLAQLFPDKDQDSFSVEDWAKVEKKAPEQTIPF